MIKSILFILLFSSSLFASESGNYDYQGNGVTSNLSSGTRNPFDVQQVYSGSLIDPRSRVWNLTSSDVPACTQSGAWSVTSNAGTNLNTSLLQLQSGANTYLDKTGTGTITALNGSVVATTNGASSVNFAISGTWVATLSFDGSTDGVTYTPIIGDVISVFGAPTNVPAGTLALNGLVTVSAGGFTHIRISAAAYTSGTVNVSYAAGAGLQTLQVYNTVASSFLSTVSQGTSPWVDNISQFGGTNVSTGTGNGGAGIPRVTVSTDSFSAASVATSTKQSDGTQKTQVVDASGNVQPSGDTVGRKIFTAHTDGTNTQAVKAASTAAASTDPGAVVVLSSNFPVLTGTTGTAVSVGVTSTSTVASNANRAGLILVNTSTARESCTVGTAVLNSGVTLFPGGTWTMDQYTFTTAAINCIAGAAASNISVQEFTK